MVKVRWTPDQVKETLQAAMVVRIRSAALVATGRFQLSTGWASRWSSKVGIKPPGKRKAARREWGPPRQHDERIPTMAVYKTWGAWSWSASFARSSGVTSRRSTSI